MTYHGGPVQHSSAVYAIFWEPPSYAFPAGYISLVTRYLTDIARDSFKTSNVYAAGTQYYDNAGGAKRFASYAVSFKKLIVDTNPLPPDGCPNYRLSDGSTSTNCITDEQMVGELESIVAASHFPRGLSSNYFVFTPQALGQCADDTGDPQGCNTPLAGGGNCAWHGSTDATSSALLFADIPYPTPGTDCHGPWGNPNGNAADLAVDTVSHEHNEMITDPLLNAWYANVADGGENGDQCETSYGTPIGTTSFGKYNQVINSHPYSLQEEWSNRAHACVQRNRYPQPTASLAYSPVHALHGTKVMFTVAAHDSDDTQFTYRWTFAGASASTSPNPAYAFSTAGAKTVTLVVSDAHGDQTRVVRTISVT